MRWVREAWSRLRGTLGRRRLDREMEEELGFHIDMATERNLRRGMDPAEARRRALIDFGGVERHTEAGRDEDRSRWLEDIVHDLRYAGRSLLRTPAFTREAAGAIALGVGATTAVVSVTTGMLFRPLPAVAEPDRLVSLEEERSGMTSTSFGHSMIPYPRYQAYREATGSAFAGLAAERLNGYSVRLGESTVAVFGALASGNYFDVLGVRPAAGRFFTSDDEPAVVLGYDLWRDHLGGDPGVVGSTVYLNSQPFTVAGVAPRGFGGTTAGLGLQAWVPVEAYRSGPDNGPEDVWVTPFGRLRAGVEPERAAALADVAARRIPPDESHTVVRGARLEPLTGISSEIRAGAARFMAILLAAGALVLLIASANVAGMLLARAVERRREVVVRLAIGAGRGRIVRQLLTESVLLFLIGGAAGVVLAVWGTALLSRVRLPYGPFQFAFDVSPDGRVLVIALALTAATGILFGLLPATEASRPDLAAALKNGTRGAGQRTSRGRSLFVAGQLAMAVLLLVTASLFVRSLLEGLTTDPGFDADGVLVATTNVGPHGYDEERGRAFYAQLLERVRAVPGVEEAGLSSVVLLSGQRMGSDTRRAEDGPDGFETNAAFTRVDPGYFDAMRIELVSGRPLRASDGPGAPPVVVINETLARQLWPDESALGRRLRFLAGDREVVGVVRDGKYARIDEAATPFVFVPFAQEYTALMTLHVRAPGDGAGVLERIAGEVRALEPDVALQGAMPLSVVVGNSLFLQRFAAALVGLFGLLGLALAAIGVYAVLAFHVGQRTREFGIRIALGARSNDVLRQVVGRGALLALVGAGAGLLLAAVATRFVGGFLVGVSPLDPLTFIGVPLVLGATALLASYVPARRATRADPMEVLRSE